MRMRSLVYFLIALLTINIGVIYAQSLDINDQSAGVGDKVTFTVSMSNIPNAVGSMMFEVSYDTSVLDFTGNYTEGALVTNFAQVGVNEATSGQIRVVGYTTSEIALGSSGEVVKLEFTVKNCTNSTLTLTGLEDDLSGWSTGDGDFSCTTTTETPTPTQTPTQEPSPAPTTTPEFTPPPTLPPTFTLPPVASPTRTPSLCEAESVSVSPTGISLKRKKSSTVTVTVTGADGCAVEGETVVATISAAGRKRISISPTSTSTDENGEAIFTITAKKINGNARVTFKAGSVKKSMTVRVRR